MTDLLLALDDDDPEIRRRAVAQLGTTGRPEDRARLMERLGDVDWRVRKEAVQVSLDLAADWELLPALVEGVCQSENVGLRNAALEVLERVGAGSADALLSALPSAPPAARKFIVAALGFAGGRGLDKLAELSQDEEPNTARAALGALARAGGPRAERALHRHLDSVDPVQRLVALEGLERMEATLSLEELAPLLADRVIRRSALRLLGFSNEPAALSAIFEAVEEGGPGAAQATIALGRILDRGGALARQLRELAPKLSEGVRRGLTTVAEEGVGAPRRAATTTLILARADEILPVAATLAAHDELPPSAVDALRAWGVGAVKPLLTVAARPASAESDPSPWTRAAALEMAADLAAAGSPTEELVETLRRELVLALQEDDAVLVVAAAEALALFVAEDNVPALLAAAERFDNQAAPAVGRAFESLAASRPHVVSAALRGASLDGALGAALIPAIAALDETVAFPLLSSALNAADPRARRAAVVALGKFSGDRAAELAGFALADEDVDVQVAAVMVLSGLRDANGEAVGTEQLRLALRSPTGPVAAAAARMVGRLGDRASAPVLRELVGESRPEVAVAAMESLRRFSDPALDDLLVDALGQNDEELVKEALRALAETPRISRRAARIALALEHPAWDVRLLAADLLASVEGPEVTEALRARLPRETDPAVIAAMENTLSTRAEGD